MTALQNKCLNYNMWMFSKYDGSIEGFIPTKEKQLRLICWKVKPWKQPKASYGQPRLFTSAFGAGWGVDCDEVCPNLFIGR